MSDKCEPWGCDGSGRNQQGTSYKAGYAEPQYAPCGYPCRREAEADPMTAQLPPSYWIDQIRADLARRREAEDGERAEVTETFETEEQR